ncbi:CbtA family protein [Pseudosporangium ferrugineum]|uniref:Putative cobalt transporter subunit CbtA n=1 Tax=Pseudosporangium ferrugineum TaxID=439699 RepID=A0A2T0SHJ7_9ACTN|nr:CbtA family protein [Pseudosporangium ferrugineum]PRY32882.1 putative cobalt transporter subunit CbtA [Pseudosporangium ferrugineum]
MSLTPAGTAPGYGALLLRGLLAGLIAGLLAGAFAYTFGEPKVEAAIAIEEAASHAEAAAPAAAGHAQDSATADDHHGEDALVSRNGQKGGLFLATALYGVAMGGLLATAYALLRRRLRTAHDSRAALGLAGAALLGLVLVPFVKYPPNPPAVGDPATIDQRTISYLSVVVIGLVAVWAAVLASRSPRVGAPEWVRACAGLGAFLVVVVVGYVLLPNIDEVPSTFPPSLLWNFRLSSLGTQVTMWTVLGLAFTALLSRLGPVRPAVPREPSESVAV